ncbi:outer membrane protein assembly factor BamB family protein [Rhodococcoides corynebacterioides]|uniref:outer membrane protein assembly factor BamB family protein n=1 Tax=Rhodococcoides corynebacterioides TaxID=53972 RepID=UPI001C9ACC4E|nr:PQQ-binding-like beta-propeller repeat protein [Rhodococcus corynebacterioides]MBY6349107.1 PQQ-binding-like beta-propeller repeat protein [Rhodococcus corynebacterioides]
MTTPPPPPPPQARPVVPLIKHTEKARPTTPVVSLSKSPRTTPETPPSTTDTTPTPPVAPDRPLTPEEPAPAPFAGPGDAPASSTEPGGAPRSERRRVVLLGAAAAAVVVALAAAVFVVVRPDSGSQTTTVADVLTGGTFPTAPTAAWSLEPSTVVPGSDSYFFSPLFGEQDYERPGAVVDGERAFVAARDGSTRSTTVAAVDAADGTVEWTQVIDNFGGCANATLDGRLPCIDRGSTPGSSSVQFLDASTGAVDSTHEVAAYVGAVYVSGSNLYVSGWDQNAEASVISKGTVDDPTASWSRSYPDDRCSIAGNGDSSTFDVVGSVLVKMSGTSVVADTANGDLVISNTGYSYPLGGRAVMTNRCPDSPASGEFSPAIVSSDGLTTATPYDAPIDYAFVADADPSAPFLYRGGGAVDPVTGDFRWARPDLADKTSEAAMIGSTIIVPSGDRTEALDVATGDTLWTAPRYGATVDATDGRAFLSTADSTLAAFSLADGSELWSVPLYPLDERGGTLETVGDGFLYAGSGVLHRFDPTGPPAGAIAADDADAGSSDSSDSYVTACGTPPTFTPTEVTTDSGALVVTMEVRATCPAGDVLSSDAMRLSITRGGANVASALFDMSDAPLAVPGVDAGSGSGGGGFGSVQQSFRFPVGSFWLPPDSSTGSTRGSTSGGTRYVVDCDRGESAGARAQLGSDVEPVTASAPAEPATGTSESAAFDALRAIANADRPVILRDLGERWVPQLSSKKPGLVADGTTWNNSSTLAEHLDLRLKYPNVKLMWSGEWSVFSFSDFWVTAAGATFSDPAGANRWCDQNGLDADHCFAKLISATHPIAGSTASR